MKKSEKCTLEKKIHEVHVSMYVSSTTVVHPWLTKLQVHLTRYITRCSASERQYFSRLFDKIYYTPEMPETKSSRDPYRSYVKTMRQCVKETRSKHLSFLKSQQMKPNIRHLTLEGTT